MTEAVLYLANVELFLSLCVVGVFFLRLRWGIAVLEITQN